MPRLSDPYPAPSKGQAMGPFHQEVVAMDFDAIDRAMSRAVIRQVEPDHGRFWIADNDAETLTDIPQRARIYSRLADAWDACDRLSLDPGFLGRRFEARSVVDLYEEEEDGK
jgi:hypothetical protein